MIISLGPVLICFLTIAVLTGYLYFILYKSNTIFLRSVKLLFGIIVVIMCRMLFPINFPFTYSIYDTEILPILVDIANYPVVLFHLEMTVSFLFALIWTCGAAILLIRYFYLRKTTRKYLMQYVVEKEALTPHYQACLENVKMTNFHVAIIPNQYTAAIFGLIQPIMILPDCRLSDIEYVIQHEISHYRNYDLLLKFLVDILVTVHWWNPFAYFMRKKLNLAFELSNDFVVSQEMNERKRLEYAESLLRAAKLSSCTKKYDLALVDKTQIELRINMLLKRPHEKNKKVLFRTHIVFLLTIMLISLFIVPEGINPIPPEDVQGSFEITPENAYFIKVPDGYTLYVEGQPPTTFENIPDALEYVPVYEGEN